MRTKDPEKEVHRLAIWYGDSILSGAKPFLVTLQYLVSILMVISLSQRAVELGDITFQTAGERSKGDTHNSLAIISPSKTYHMFYM